METPLTILYTHNLQGDLALLPRLHTFLRRLRAEAQRYEDDDSAVMVCAIQPPARRVLLVDAGASCAPDVWHCRVTGGRSALVALDALGYDAALATDLLPDARAKLAASVQLAPVAAGHPAARDGILITAEPLDRPAALQFVLQPRAAAALIGRQLYPAALRAGAVGVLHVALAGGPRLSAQHVFPLPPGTRPDPTIAGAVDFVLSEARFAARKQAR